MPALQAAKGLFGYKPSQPDTSNLDTAEKAQPQGITADDLEKPKKSYSPRKLAFHTFIQTYKRPYSYCKVVAIVITGFIVTIFILVLLLACGVFEEAKELAESHATNEVLDYIPSHSSRANSY